MEYEEGAGLVQEDGAFKALEEDPIFLDFLEDVRRTRVRHIHDGVIRVLINADGGYQPADRDKLGGMQLSRVVEPLLVSGQML